MTFDDITSLQWAFLHFADVLLTKQLQWDCVTSQLHSLKCRSSIWSRKNEQQRRSSSQDDRHGTDVYAQNRSTKQKMTIYKCWQKCRYMQIVKQLQKWMQREVKKLHVARRKDLIWPLSGLGRLLWKCNRLQITSYTI